MKSKSDGKTKRAKELNDHTEGAVCKSMDNLQELKIIYKISSLFINYKLRNQSLHLVMKAGRELCERTFRIQFTLKW